MDLDSLDMCDNPSDEVDSQSMVLSGDPIFLEGSELASGGIHDQAASSVSVSLGDFGLGSLVGV